MSASNSSISGNDRSLSRSLFLTERGQQWLSQFEDFDQEAAKDLLSALTLVSHTDFARSIELLIRSEAAKVEGPVAMYATREVTADGYFGEEHSVLGLDAVGRGNDVGSEGRVAAIIRNISRTDRQKFLNHPGIEKMRSSRCKALFVIDDLIGSGERTRTFIDAMWRNRTIRSWWSLKYLRVFAIAYATTEKGEHRVRKARSKPDVVIHRGCPTFDTLPWAEARREAIRGLCKKYVKQTSVSLPFGFENTNATLIFEHGSPDNVPAILWAPSTEAKRWKPLFPGRSVLPGEQSAFPAEIARRDPITVLVDAGQRRLAGSLAVRVPHPLGLDVLIILGFAAKGIRSLTALSYATGLPAQECADLQRRCVGWGLLLPTGRATTQGLAELAAARKTNRVRTIPPRGEETYYPQSLRGRIRR